MATPTLRPLSMGEILDVSFALFRSKFQSLLLVAIVTQVVPTVLGIYLAASGTGGVLVHPVLFLVQSLLALVLIAIAVAATTSIVSGAYMGHEISAGDALFHALALSRRLVLISILTALAMVLGVLVFFIGVFVVIAAFSLSSVVAVVESSPSATAAMGRSWVLTRGNWLKILSTMLVPALLLWVPVFAATLIWGLVSSVGVMNASLSIVPGVLAGVLSVFVRPYLYVVFTVLYYDLRVRKEGLDLEILAGEVQPA